MNVEQGEHLVSKSVPGATKVRPKRVLRRHALQARRSGHRSLQLLGVSVVELPGVYRGLIEFLRGAVVFPSLIACSRVCVAFGVCAVLLRLHHQ